MINGVKEKINENKKYIIIGVLLLIGAIICWNVFSNGDNVRRIEPIRSELNTTSEYQQSIDKRLDVIEKGLNSSANRLGGVSERITNNTERVITVERRIENSQAGINESNRIISESKSIIDNVRKRN